MSNDEMLRQEPCATSPSIDSTMAGRWNASTSFDATIPMTPRCQPSPATTSTVRAPTSGSLSTIFFAAADDRRLFLLPPRVLLVQLFGQPARLARHRLVGGEQQARRDVGVAHAPGGVHPRSDHEPDVVAVDRLSREARRLDECAQTHLVRPLREQFESELRDDAVLADERHHVGQRANRGDLHERRQPAVASGARAERLDQLQRDADAREVLVRDTCSRGASG